MERFEQDIRSLRWRERRSTYRRLFLTLMKSVNAGLKLSVWKCGWVGAGNPLWVPWVDGVNFFSVLLRNTRTAWLCRRMCASDDLFFFFVFFARSSPGVVCGNAALAESKHNLQKGGLIVRFQQSSPGVFGLSRYTIECSRGPPGSSETPSCVNGSFPQVSLPPHSQTWRLSWVQRE